MGDSLKRVVFIACPGHSGSTLLELILSGHSQFIGLGELFNLIKPGSEMMQRAHEFFCSCKKSFLNCPYWHDVYKRINQEPNPTSQNGYKIILDTFFQKFGNNTVPVDSSKTIIPLKTIYGLKDIDLKVIFLIKDVRSFTISCLDLHKREKVREPGMKKIQVIPRIMQNSPHYYFWVWYNWNRRMRTFLDRNQIPFIKIGYEELCLYPEEIVKKMCKFLETDIESSMLSLNESTSHSVFGNRMRSQKAKRQRILYDNRWFKRNEWKIPSILYPHIMKYNANEVYSNNLDSIWET